MNGMNSKQLNQTRVSATTVLLYVIILLSFTAHIFAYTMSTSVYVYVLMVFSVLYAFGRPRVLLKKNWPSMIWIAAVAVAFMSLARSSRTANSILDVTCLFCGMLIAIFFSKADNYLKTVKLIYLVSMFFAASVVLQVFVPSVFNGLLNLFPEKYAAAVGMGANEVVGSGKRGFTTNTGTAAAYICSGLLALGSITTRRGRVNTKKVATAFFLFLGLMFTGKRGHALFVILAMLIRYLLPERGTKKMKKYWVIFLSFLSIIVFYSIFGSLLSEIPLIRKLTATINGVIAGDDISSLRLSLYVWAIRLFRRNPLIGIGWGDYRTTVIGNVSRFKDLDTHNIYLQLLCETGIIGFAVFVLLFVTFWVLSKNAYCRCLADDNNAHTNWLQVLSFSFSYQSFFLLYGLTGNVLYDQHSQILYALSCGMTLAYIGNEKQHSEQKEENISGG